MSRVPLNLKGKRFGKLVALEMLAHEPNRGRVWLFQCDCGKQVKRSGGQVRYAATNPERFGYLLHCGCGIKVRKEGHRPSYNVWTQWKRSGRPMVQAWKEDYWKFKEECHAFKNGRYLVRLDRTQPLDPNNFAWSHKKEAYHDTVDRAAKALVNRGEGPIEKALARCWSVSKQRLYQLLDRDSLPT